MRGVESFGIVSGHHGDPMPAHFIRELVGKVGKYIRSAIEQRAIELDIGEASEDRSLCCAGACKQCGSRRETGNTGVTGAVGEDHHDGTGGLEPAVHHEFMARVTYYQQGRASLQQGPDHDGANVSRVLAICTPDVRNLMRMLNRCPSNIRGITPTRSPPMSDPFARIWVCPVCQVHRRADLPREHGPRGGRPCVGGRRAGSFAGRGDQGGRPVEAG